MTDNATTQNRGRDDAITQNRGRDDATMQNGGRDNATTQNSGRDNPTTQNRNRPVSPDIDQQTRFGRPTRLAAKKAMQKISEHLNDSLTN